MTEIGSISNYESGEVLILEWGIQDFSTLDECDGTYYDSPDFSFGGDRWYLAIFPNGSSGPGTSGHVDLGLRKYLSDRSPKVSFSLSLKTAEGEKYNEKHCTKDFRNSYPENYHELLRFISRPELTRLRSDLLPDDVLTVVCTMRWSTPGGSEILKRIVENYKVAPKGKKRKTENGNPGSAENCSSDSDSGESSSDSESVACCHKCPNCLSIVKKQKKLLEKLESQKETSEGAASLCEDYKKMLSDGRHHDLILKVGDKELRAHRDVLRVRSRVFESMLDHDMKEGNTGVIDVPDFDPDVMELFLSYAYCGKIEALDHSNMLGLYYVADKYEMMDLKRECSDFIKKSLSLTNICSVIQLALNHSDSELLDYTSGYFAENMVEIMQTVEWQSFHKDNFTVGNEFIMKSIKKLKDAQT